MRKLLLKYWAIAIIILAWGFIASPYLVKHKIPYPSTYQVSNFTPWNSYRQYQIPTKNAALSDVIDQIFPWKYFTIEMLKKGQLPLWNPYSFAGNPHLADSQTAVLSPLNLLFFLLPFIDAWSLLILLQPLLAGIGMYLLLREFKISSSGKVIGSIAFMFCGFVVVWMPYGTLSLAIAVLPLALYSIEKLFSHTFRRSIPAAIFLPATIAFSFFSGHLQTSVYFMLYIVGFLIFKYLTTRKTKQFFIVAMLFLIGITLSSLQLIPTLQLYQQAPRSQEFSNAGGIPWHYLVTLIAPDFYGNPVTRNDWFGKYAEWASFIGIIPLLLVFMNIFQQKEKAKALFFTTAGITALLLALDTSLQNILLALKLPVFSTSIPSRIIVLFSFSLAVLAGFGTDMCQEYLQKKKTKKILTVILVLGIPMTLIWLTLVVFKPLPADKLPLATRNFFLSTAFLLFTAAMFIIYLLFKKKKLAITIIGLLICLTIFDSLRFAQKWLPFDNAQYIFPSVPVITAMQQKVGQGRVYGNFGAYIDTYYHLPAIEGYDPLYIRHYGEFIASAKTGSFQPAVHSLALLDKRGKYAPRVLDVLGVTVLYHRKDDTFTSWTFPVWEDRQRYRKIYEDEKFELFQNTTALPRAKLFYDYEVIPQEKKSIARFYNNDFDYKNKIILQEDPRVPKTNNMKGKTTITEYSPNKIKIEVTSPAPALLFLSDNYYPAWKAYLNGKETKILNADYSFRAVTVPQGKSTIEFAVHLF